MSKYNITPADLLDGLKRDVERASDSGRYPHRSTDSLAASPTHTLAIVSNRYPDGSVLTGVMALRGSSNDVGYQSRIEQVATGAMSDEQWDQVCDDFIVAITERLGSSS